MSAMRTFNRALAICSVLGLYASSAIAAGGDALPARLGPSSFEQQGEVNRVDVIRSIVWIDGKPYKVTGATRFLADSTGPSSASASISAISVGDRASFLAGEGGTIRALRFGSGIKR